MSPLVLVILAAAAPDAAVSPPPAELARLVRQPPTKEEVTSTVAEHGLEGIRGAKATFVVKGDRDAVLATLWDVEAFPEIFPDIDSMKVLHKAKHRIDVRFEVDAVVTKAAYTLRRQLDEEKGVIRWREVGEGDVKHIRGSWSVEPLGEGYSRVVYASYVDVGYFVPTSAVRDVAIKKIDELAERVRGAVERHAKRHAKKAAGGPSPAGGAPAASDR